MQATQVYRQDTIVQVFFDGGQVLSIDTGGRHSAEDVREAIESVIGYLSDVSFLVRFT